MKQISVDVICHDHNFNRMPLFNDLQANTLNDTQFFKINKLFKVRVGNVGHPSEREELKKYLLSPEGADILISICPDQHNYNFDPTLIHPKKYKKIVYINDEPIYNHRSWGGAKNIHDNFLKNSTIDVIFYCSPADKEKSPADCIKLDWYCSDTPDNTRSKLPLNEKIFRSISSSTVWKGTWLGRKKFFDRMMELKVHNEKLGHYEILLFENRPWLETTSFIEKSKICVIPPHGFDIHMMRLLRSWRCNTLPVIVNSDGWINPFVTNEYSEIFDQNGKTILLTELKDLEKTIESLQNEKYVDSLLENIKKLDLSKYSLQNTWKVLYQNLNIN